MNACKRRDAELPDPSFPRSAWERGVCSPPLRRSADRIGAGQRLGPVSYQRIVQAEKEPQHWLTYSGNYNSHRFCTLNQITTKNVTRLRTAWIYQVKHTGVVEASPIVVDGSCTSPNRPAP